MESQLLVSEFMSQTGANPKDAISCLKTWGWDLKRAITDYNDTCKLEDLQNNHEPNLLIPTKLIEIDDNNTNETNSNSNTILVNLTTDGIHSSGKRRPTLIKSDSIDIVDYRKLSRGISRATDNINLVSRARTEIAMDFRSNCHKNLEQLNTQIDKPDFTFLLPNIFDYTDQFRNFLEKDLIECSTLSALEQSNRLNWWVDNRICRKLWPLATTGDGNCLLHAASLGMWGFHDRKLTLRKALHSILSNGRCRDALWRRWRFQQARHNKKAGFVYSEIEWAKEWDELISMSSPEPRNNLNVRRRFSTSDRHSLISSDSIDDAATYESLEEIHILALAHVLRRTIIVVSDTVLKDLNGEAMAPITFGGIYVPFEIDTNDCNRGPLLLAYDMAHFSALVPMETGCDHPPALIPLIDFENQLLPIQFCIDPGENFNWLDYDGSEGNWALTDREQVALLKVYLDIVYVPTNGSPDDEIFDDLTDDEFDKKFCESEMIIQAQQQLIDDQTFQQQQQQQQQTKSKAAKQLQSVAKQFGSIGKSMSKKIKKNIGSITKIGSKNGTASQNGSQKSHNLKNTLSSGSSTQSFTCTRLLCAKLRIKRHEFQEEMIRNYLEFAHTRYLDSEMKRDKGFDLVEHGGGVGGLHQLEYLTLDEQRISDRNHPLNAQKQMSTESQVYCINAGCNNLASSDTSYLCIECFEMQKQRESNTKFINNASPRYGTGKSKFYTQADIVSHENIKNIPSARRGLNELDQTLYLSNSTFYNDNIRKSAASTGSKDNSLVNNTRESLYRHGYSPTVRLIDEQIEDQAHHKIVVTTEGGAAAAAATTPAGTVSVFSPGNTLKHEKIITTSAAPTELSRILAEQNSQRTTNQIGAKITNNFSQSITNNNEENNTTFESIPCRTICCLFYGTSKTNFLCSKCFKLELATAAAAVAASKMQVNGTSCPPPSPPPSSTTLYPSSRTAITKSSSKIMSDI